MGLAHMIGIHFGAVVSNRNSCSGSCQNFENSVAADLSALSLNLVTIILPAYSRPFVRNRPKIPCGMIPHLRQEAMYTSK